MEKNKQYFVNFDDNEFIIVLKDDGIIESYERIVD